MADFQKRLQQKDSSEALVADFQKRLQQKDSELESLRAKVTTLIHSV